MHKLSILEISDIIMKMFSKYKICCVIIVLIIVLECNHVNGLSIGSFAGKFTPFRNDKNEGSDTTNNDIKNRFFVVTNSESKPPAHDSPASRCSCRKYFSIHDRKLHI